MARDSVRYVQLLAAHVHSALVSVASQELQNYRRVMKTNCVCTYSDTKMTSSNKLLLAHMNRL